MAELRKDPTTRRWAIIATERIKRPNELVKKKGGAKTKRPCPFDPGSDELAAGIEYPHFKQPDKYKVWVVPNRVSRSFIRGRSQNHHKGSVHDHRRRRRARGVRRLRQARRDA